MRMPILLLLLCLSVAARAEEATVAVAANFSAPAAALAESFARQPGGHRVRISSGSTGGLYTSIKQGAPYDLLLSADSARPQRLAEEGDAVAASRCTYALGQLVLWSTDADRIGDDPRAALQDPALRHLAIANPDVAPYGAAAREVLQGFGLWEPLAAKRVQGMDISQTWQMVASGNAELGFVAASALSGETRGSRWNVPPGLHAPLAQDAVLLKRGADNAAAVAFLRYLGSAEARALIRAQGYALADSGACGG